MEAKTIKIGNEYYREGVKVPNPNPQKKVVKKAVSKKSAKGGLAGMLADEKARRSRFSSGGLGKMLFSR